MKSVRLTAGLLMSLAVCTTSCQENEAEPAQDTVQVKYAQTYCADAWGQAPTPQQLETVVGNYLQQKGIVVQRLEAARTGQEAVCNACNCTTGVTLQASVRASDLPAMLSLGFTQ